MKKVALVFALAVIAPSLVLAWMAVRSVRDQQLVVERQQTLLYQGIADNIARQITRSIESFHDEFNRQVEALVQKETPLDLATRFDERLRAVWSPAEVGFAVSLDGQLLSPSLFGSPLARKFRLENERFLCSRESVEVYWNTPKGLISEAKLDSGKDLKSSKDQPDPESKAVASKSTKAPRTVTPEKETDAGESKVSAEQAEFQTIVGDAMEGTLARFLQDKLKLLFWYRSPRESKLVFGAQVNLAQLIEVLNRAVEVEPALRGEISVALLDDIGKPVALSDRHFKPRNATTSPNPLGRSRLPRPLLQHNALSTSLTGEVAETAASDAEIRSDWKHPFVSTEIGELLPHWEVAVYLFDPSRLKQSAHTLRLLLGLVVLLLLLAIAVGSGLIVADLRRQLILARQKTDFVSNVSHELKTPLTSIRMFSEMLASDRALDPGKRQQFLNIITSETARLTRLINNVLDFARMERGEKKYDFRPLDLAALVDETVEAYRPHLEASAFALKLAPPAPDAPLMVRGDRDAIAQVVVNLLSNAEKYSGDAREIEVRIRSAAGTVTVEVLDRGAGVPAGCEEKIFEQFYRAHDSLASGVQGSGLGLTLARQIARAHGGEVTYRARAGGGSCFALCLPAA